MLNLTNRAAVTRVDFLERKFPGVVEKIGTHQVRIPYKPYKIIGLLVR